ncbi:30S ribosomal protein S8 [Candidatus Saccharibacteria bacterium]|nr:30S ribosomal protein S8 [Candidatus Saccharibacteria bacterium]
MSIQSTDQIADLLTRIRNCLMVGKNEIYLPTSKLKVAVVEALKASGYLADYELVDNSPRKILRVVIAEPGKVPAIHEIEKVSKPGRRVYVAVDEIPKVKSGRGLVLISTSKGIMTGRDAIKERLGGELLVKVW